MDSPAPALRVPAATHGDDACGGAKTLATVVADEVLSEEIAGLPSTSQFHSPELPVVATIVEVVLPEPAVLGVPW